MNVPIYRRGSLYFSFDEKVQTLDEGYITAAQDKAKQKLTESYGELASCDVVITDIRFEEIPNVSDVIRVMVDCAYNILLEEVDATNSEE